MAIVKIKESFRDLTRQRLPTSSRLNIYNILQDTSTNQYFVNPFRHFVITEELRTDNKYYTIHYALEEEWWDNISYQHYKTPQYWYILCEYNKVINPYESLIPGQTIKILKEHFMYRIFIEMRNIAKL